MPAILASLFGSLASFFGIMVAKKTAMALAAVAVFATLTAALMAAIAGAISTVLTVIPLPSAVVFGMWYFMPENLPACASALISANVAAALYRWNVQNLQLVAQAQ
jgi:hypothetical protein